MNRGFNDSRAQYTKGTPGPVSIDLELPAYATSQIGFESIVTRLGLGRPADRIPFGARLGVLPIQRIGTSAAGSGD